MKCSKRNFLEAGVGGSVRRSVVGDNSPSPRRPYPQRHLHIVLSSYLQYLSSPIWTLGSSNNSLVSCGFPAHFQYVLAQTPVSTTLKRPT